MAFRSVLLMIALLLLNVIGNGQEPAYPTLQPLTALNIGHMQHVYTIRADALETITVAEVAPFTIPTFQIDWDRNRIISNRPGTAELDFWQIEPFRKLKSLDLEEVTPLSIRVFKVVGDHVLIAGADDFLTDPSLNGFIFEQSSGQSVFSVQHLLAYSDDLSLIAYADQRDRSDSREMELHVYDTQFRREIGSLPSVEIVTAEFSADKTRLMILTVENELIEIDLLRLVDPVRILARFPEERALISARYTGVEAVTVIRSDVTFGSLIESWNTRTGEVINSVHYPVSLAQFWYNDTIHVRNVQDETSKVLDLPSLELLKTLSLSQSALSINLDKSLLIIAEANATGAIDYRIIDILNDDDLGRIPITLPEVDSANPYQAFFMHFSATGNGIELIETTSVLSEDQYPIVKMIGYFFWGVSSH